MCWDPQCVPGRAPLKWMEGLLFFVQSCSWWPRCIALVKLLLKAALVSHIFFILTIAQTTNVKGMLQTPQLISVLVESLINLVSKHHTTSDKLIVHYLPSAKWQTKLATSWWTKWSILQLKSQKKKLVKTKTALKGERLSDSHSPGGQKLQHTSAIDANVVRICWMFKSAAVFFFFFSEVKDLNTSPTTGLHAYKHT